MSYIYITTNKINNKKYIGKSTRDSTTSKGYIGGGDILKAAIKKYGCKNFKKEIIVEGNFNKNLLNELETHYIQLHSAHISKEYYNISLGGIYDSKYHKESKHKSFNRKIYKYDSKGTLLAVYKNSREAAKSVENGNQGALMNAIAKKRPYKNFYFSRNRKSILFIEKICKPKVIKKSQAKPCYIFSLNGEFIEKINSINECAIKLNVVKDVIRHAYKCNIPVGDYVICKTNNFTINLKSKKFKAVAIYNENECKLFYKYKDALNFLVSHYPELPSNAGQISNMLTRGLKVGDFCLRELFVDNPKIADKNSEGWISRKSSTKIVYQYSSKGDLLNKYESVLDASNSTGVPYKTLNCVIAEKCFNEYSQSFYSYCSEFDNCHFTIPRAKAVGVYSILGELITTCKTKKAASDYIGVPEYRVHAKKLPLTIANYIIK